MARLEPMFSRRQGLIVWGKCSALRNSNKRTSAVQLYHLSLFLSYNFTIYLYFSNSNDSCITTLCIIGRGIWNLIDNVSRLVAQKSRSAVTSRQCPEIVMCHVADTSAAEALSLSLSLCVCVCMFLYFCSFHLKSFSFVEDICMLPMAGAVWQSNESHSTT